MDIQRTSVAEFKCGTETIDTTPVQAGPAFICLKGVSIKAALDNNDNVYVGHNEFVSASNGFQLDAGEEVFIEIDMLDKVWVVGGAASQTYSYKAV